MLITKDQSSKVCEHFLNSDWLFLINLSSLSSKENAMRTALKSAMGEILYISKIPDILWFHNIKGIRSGQISQKSAEF